MEKISTIVNRIRYASSKEIGRILEDYNIDVFGKNDWNLISVKSFYSSVIEEIDEVLRQHELILGYGNETIKAYDCATGKETMLDVKQTLINLKLAKEFFVNPPVVEKGSVQQEHNDVVIQSCENAKPSSGVKSSSEKEDDNIIKGIAGLKDYLSVGTTKAQAILNSGVLQKGGIAFNAGSWRIYKDKLDEFIKQNPTLLRDIKCPH